MSRLVLALLTLTSLPLVAQLPETVRSISVSGEAVVMVVPDQAVVTIGVETFDPKLDAAAATNDRVARALIAEWKRLGVIDTSIKTSGVSVEIAYDRDNTPPRTIEGYVVRRAYDITPSSAALAEQIITRGLAAGANQISQISFRTTEMRRYRDQARVSAVKAAREKAELIAAQLGATVGPPRSINETTSDYSPRYAQNSMSQNVTSYASDSGDADSAGAVAPGQVAVRASVAVTFDLIPK